MTSIRVATLNLWGRNGAWRDRMQLAAEKIGEKGCQVVFAQEVATDLGTLPGQLGLPARILPVGQTEFGLAILSSLSLAQELHLRLPSPQNESRWLLSAHAPEQGIWLHCTHLSHRLKDGAWRQKQVHAIAKALQGYDPDGLHVLGGDMNALPQSDEMRFMRGLCCIEGASTHMQDCWLRHHEEGESGHTWCMQEGEERARRSNDVDGRLDYLYASTRAKGGRGQVLQSGTLCQSPNAQGLWASDHCAVWAEIQLEQEQR